jgi:hypothetical protein
VTIQMRVLQASRSQDTADPSRGIGSVGEPATWIRRYVALLSTAELVVHLFGRLPGALVYALVSLLLLNHQLARDVVWGTNRVGGPRALGDRPLLVPSPIYLVLSIVALTRMASLATSDFSTTWFGGFAFASIPTALALRRFARLSGGVLPAGAWGKASWRQALVAIAALPLALVGVLASHPRPTLDWWDLSWQYWAMLALFGLSGCLDEIFYQGIVRPALGDAMGTSGAAGCAFLYALTHADVELGVLFALVAANAVFGLAVQRTRMLVGACAGRVLLNVLIVFALPYWLPH